MKIKLLSIVFLVICMMSFLGAELVIRPLTVTDWKKFRDLRLKALTEAPKAYGIAVEDEAYRSDDEWKKICIDSYHGDSKWYYVAEAEGTLVGVLGATEIFGKHMRHQVEICSAYVEEPFQRQGIMTQLYAALKARLQQVPHLEQMIVWVTLHETQNAMPMFEKFGFKYAGKLSKTVKFEDSYYDCCWLEASL